MYCKLCDKDFSDTEVTRWENEVYCPACGHSIKLTDSRNTKLTHMDSRLIGLARSNYESMSTSELITRWENIYGDEDLTEAVEAIRQILIERGVSLPSQKSKKPSAERLSNIAPTYILALSTIMIVAGIGWVLVCGSMIINPTKHYVMDASGRNFHIERDFDPGYLIMAFFSLLTIATGYGLRKLQYWARTSALAILTISALFLGINLSIGKDIIWSLGYAIGVVSVFIHPIYYLSKSDTAKLFIKATDKTIQRNELETELVSVSNEYHCSNCNSVVTEQDTICPKCGGDLGETVDPRPQH